MSQVSHTDSTASKALFQLDTSEHVIESDTNDNDDDHDTELPSLLDIDDGVYDDDDLSELKALMPSVLEYLWKIIK